MKLRQGSGKDKQGMVIIRTLKALKLKPSPRAYTKGHIRVTIGHLRVTVGHPRVTIGHLKATVVYIRKGNYRLFRQLQLSFTPK